MQLNDGNFELFAAHFYDVKKATSYEEFRQDLKRITYLKKLFLRYDEQNDLQSRLILNHLVVLYNCFGVAATPMLFMKLNKYHRYIKPYLVFLGYLPKTVMYNDLVINTETIDMDDHITNELRKI